ncbi:RecB family exonuclease [Knoellia remsis]|uniref:RecB family exonuclease n=1 Tax=Knoellia remsis TaxID=407159 RepID=A0A2T0UQL1_9MICO|nr:PD-(D/E)XK nuclease family protein [Knoellia remsis]PRY60219.1 RecB family exonuclease [Knoellia remsis]
MSEGSAGRPVQDEFAGMPPKLYAASPSRLLALLDCPRRYRMQYLDRPRPQARPQRAHTSFGLAVHNALRDWWDLPVARRTVPAGRELVRSTWIDVGFRDPDQSGLWRRRAQDHVAAYLEGVDPEVEPRGIERTVSFVSGALRVTGRVDRLDERDGELVVVDYKTSRRPSTEEEARTSLPLALYAAAVWKMFRHPCLRVELHHVPSGEVVRHTHTPESLTRKVDEAKSLARDAQRADDDFAERGIESALFPPVVGPLCSWCDFREHCPEGQAAGPEKSSWAALEDGAAMDGTVVAAVEVE